MRSMALRATPGWSVWCVLLFVPSSARAVVTETPDRDRWWAPDKALHYSVSVGLAGAGYAGGALLFEAPSARLLTGAGVALGAGVAKELYDAGRGSFFSWKDLSWDALGTASGLALSWAVDRLFFARPLSSQGGESAAAPGSPPSVTLRLDLAGHPQAGAGDVRNTTVALLVVGGW